MAKNVIEIITFNLVEGTSKEAFMAAVEETRSFVEALPGFINRHIGQTKDGAWIDVVKWQDMDSAMNAMAQFETASEVQTFAMMIDFATVIVQHIEVLGMY